MNTEAAKIIDELGGSTSLALKLGMPKRGGAQRVGNWRKRGIPPAVLIEHLAIFRPYLDARAGQQQAGGGGT
jgi:hypothetical protein